MCFGGLVRMLVNLCGDIDVSVFSDMVFID